VARAAGWPARSWRAVGIVAKVVRHPHVFADVAVSGADEVARNRNEIKLTGGGREPAAPAGIG
jgi:uncharacterized protein YabN with tetrapyrrole methylase and pyrophosphatase domain